jgi:ribosomal protein S18 acetylase RimI-like enzyme
MSESLNWLPAQPCHLLTTYRIKQQALAPHLAKAWGWNEDAQWNFHCQHFVVSQTWLLQIKGSTIGYLEARAEPQALFLINLMLLPSHQQLGWGGQIIRQLQSQHPRIDLEVLRVNVAARRFYERWGFVCCGQFEDSWQMSWQRTN